jgi:hypothetical protein
MMHKIKTLFKPTSGKPPVATRWRAVSEVGGIIVKEKTNYCMKFSNKEIIEFLVGQLKKYPQLDIRLLSEDDTELDEASTERIEHVVLDGEQTDFFLSFFDGHVNLFTPAESRQFMFIDDDIRDMFTESDTYGNIPYEGTLNNKTHKEILELLLEFVIILIGTTKIEVQGKVISERKRGYPICEFTINLTNNSGEKRELIIENIKFIIN